MNKKFSFGTLAILGILFAVWSGMAGNVLADMPSIGLANLPGAGWYSGHQVQNLGVTTATVAMSAFNGAGTSFSCGTQTVGANKSYTFQAATDCAAVGSGFQGSAVVSSDQPMAAVVNVTNKPSGGLGVVGGEATGTYQGVGGGAVATQVSFPLYKNTFGSPTKTTTFFVQNAGSATANITATYKSSTGSSFQNTYNNVPVNAMVVLNPADAGAPAGTFGSLVVIGTQPLAGAVLEHEAAPAGAAKVLQATRGFAPTDSDTKFFAPTIKRSFGAGGNVTGLQVQNVSGGNLGVTVVVTYTIQQSPTPARVGTKVVDSASIADGASVTFNASASPVLQNGELAAATVQTFTPGGKIVGTVNERTFVGALRNTTYSAIPANKATTKINLPIFKERFNNKRIGIQVQNVGGASTNIRLTYFAQDGTGPYVLTTATPLAPGAAYTFLDVCLGTVPAGSGATWGGSGQIPQGKFGSVLIESLGGQNIVAIANESVVPGSPLSQDTSNYEGFNQ